MEATVGHTQFLPSSHPQAGKADEEVSRKFESELKASPEHVGAHERNPEPSHGGADGDSETMKHDA